MAQGYKCIVYGLNVRPLFDMVNPVTLMRKDDRVWGPATTINGLLRVTINKIYRANGTVEPWENCTVAVKDSSGVYLQAIPDVEPTPTPDPAEDRPVKAVVTMASGRIHEATNFTEVV